MKKVILGMALVAAMSLSVSVSAQDTKKKECTKTEASCCKKEAKECDKKKECTKDAEKKGCCSADKKECTKKAGDKK